MGCSPTGINVSHTKNSILQMWQIPFYFTNGDCHPSRQHPVGLQIKTFDSFIYLAPIVHKLSYHHPMCISNTNGSYCEAHFVGNTKCIPPPMARPCSTRQATFAHNYCVKLSNARINRFSDGFFPSTSHLWNSLPSAVFPASFNLLSFKRQVYHHLRDQMA